MKKPTYEPHQCSECGQTTTYLISIDKGSIDIVRAMAVAIKRKGINVVHLTKEMEVKHSDWTRERALTEGVLTSHQVGNLSRPRFHGLIARVEGERGNYSITRKGLAFLKGERIPKYAIVSKTEKRQIGYFEPDELTISIHDYLEPGEYWEGIGYEIQHGRVIVDTGNHPRQTMMGV